MTAPAEVDHPWWRRHARDLAQLAAYVFVIALAAFLFFERDQRLDFDARRQYDICIGTRQAIYDTIDATDNLPTIDFSAVETDIPAIREVLDQIGAQLDGGETSGDAIRRAIPLSDCDALLE